MILFGLALPLASSKKSFGFWLWSLGALVVLTAAIFSIAQEMSVIRSQPLNSWTEDLRADCAVALTGGPNRVREGIDLLSQHSIQKLIISGVHPQVELKDIFPLKPYYGHVRTNDIILERRSLTTYGNAQQTLPLVEALHCRNLILITSRVHMERALRMFRAEFPKDFSIMSLAVNGTNEPPTETEVLSEALKSRFYALWAY